MKILPSYIQKKFLGLFAFCLFSVVVVFLVVDLVQNLDQFIDKEVPPRIIVLYYLYFVPYIVILTMPVATLLAAVFSVGSMAKHNELVAMKSLGYSLYRVMGTLLALGFTVSVLSFILAEGVAVRASRKKENIQRVYLDRVRGGISSRLQNIEIQEPPDKIITIGFFDGEKNEAKQVKVETFQGARLVSRLDSPMMYWDGNMWIVKQGYQRIFEGDKESAFPITQTLKYHFQFDPQELMLAQVKPDEMSLQELVRFVRRIRLLGGEVHQWLTDLHIRIAFPLSNLVIVLFSVPIAYNRRRRSMAVGFGISLVVCFVYFGLVKMGQTMGQKGSIPPFWGAWLGNQIMGTGGIVNLVKTRK